MSFLLFILVISSCTSHSDKNSNVFEIQGEINGQDSGIIVLSYFLSDMRIQDSAKIKNGKFVFKGKIFEPTRGIIDGGNDLGTVWVYLEPRKMKISLSKDNFSEFKMTGSKTQAESDLLNKTKNPFSERISMLRAQKDAINDSIINLKSDSSKLLLEKRAQEIDITWAQILKQYDSIEIKFVLENPKSFFAVIKLLNLESQEALSLDSLKAIFNGFDNSLKESSYGKEIFEDIIKRENIRIGAQAPYFKATDMNQQTLTLSQFKEKNVVLIDFWASWCDPCLKSLPHLKTTYNKYHHRGFEIISVSIDESRNEWIDAVKKNSLDMWYHILIAEKWPNGPITTDDIFQNYYTSGIPVQILIDKKGIIIYRHVGYSKESEQAIDKLLSQMFDSL